MKRPAQSHRKGSVHFVGRGPETVGFPTPDQIRMSIQTLVADENLDQANALAQEGLETYPENEGVLAITSLLAIVRNEWDRAVVLLDRLIAIQGDRASDFTRMMYERARTCRSGVSSDGQTVTASPATDA